MSGAWSDCREGDCLRPVPEDDATWTASTLVGELSGTFSWRFSDRVLVELFASTRVLPFARLDPVLPSYAAELGDRAASLSLPGDVRTTYQGGLGLRWTP